MNNVGMSKFACTSFERECKMLLLRATGKYLVESTLFVLSCTLAVSADNRKKNYCNLSLIIHTITHSSLCFRHT